MSEKKDHLSVGDVHNCSSKLVCPVSFVCLLICTAALVRVEILNQRVHYVEDVMAEVRQTQELIKDSTDRHAPSYENAERIQSVGEFGNKITEEGRDARKVTDFILRSFMLLYCVRQELLLSLFFF